MKKSVQMLSRGFESSSGMTDEFASFVSVFKKEFTKELEKVGATKIEIGKGHFYLSGFFTIGEQAWYFSTGDVRLGLPGFGMLYRTASDYKDYTGGSNRTVEWSENMVSNMRLTS